MPSFRFRALQRRLAGLVIFVCAWASLGAAVGLFFADQGLTGFSDPAKAVKSLGILFGLVATDLMCLMLLLAARLPIVDRALGHDRAVALHGRLGGWVVTGLGLHALFLVLGYAMREQINPVTEFMSLWHETGDFVLAVLGLGLLVLVGVSSILAVRRRYPFEVWHAIHLTTYVAVIAAIPHQFSMSGLFSSGPQRWYWAGLFLVTGFCLLTYRILLPLFASLEHRLVVTRVEPDGDDAVSIEVTGRHLERLHTDAAQFFHWRFWAPGLWWQQHPFSVSARPDAHTLRITVRRLGGGTAKLMRLQPGTKVSFEGPYGIFSGRARTRPDVVLVGAGIGIAPIRALLEDLEFAPGHATVILRAASEREIFLSNEIVAWCNYRGAKLITLVGHRAYDQDGLARWVPQQYAGWSLGDLAPEVAGSDLYVCGPAAFTEEVVAEAEAAGTPEFQIHHERFSW